MKTICLFSGGLDSTVLLWHLLHQGHEVKCLSVNYGQRHAREVLSAKRIVQLTQVEHEVADLRSVSHLLTGSALTSDIEVPEGHYAEESMRQTVVPNRNMILLSVAIGGAVSTGSDAVAFACHAGDHTIYPDCRPEFTEAMRLAASLCDWRPVEVLAPFVDKTKAEIVKIGAQLGAPLEQTWSCYQGAKLHCGRCGTCVERREAFDLAGVPDPTEYEP